MALWFLYPLTFIEIGTQKTQTTQDKVVNWFGSVLEFECRVRHLASRKWDASNAWHAMVSQLIKLSLALNGNNCAYWMVLPPDGTLNDIIYFGSFFNRNFTCLWLSLAFRIKSKLYLMAFTSCPFPTLGPTHYPLPYKLSVFLLTLRRGSFTPPKGLYHSGSLQLQCSLADLCMAGLLSLFRM